MKYTNYIPDNNFEVSVFITMTEYCHKKYIASSFRNLDEWGKYHRNNIVGDSSLGAVSRELATLFASLRLMHALTVAEISTFMILYFKHYMWRNYEPLLDARYQYTGSYY